MSLLSTSKKITVAAGDDSDGRQDHPRAFISFQFCFVVFSFAVLFLMQSHLFVRAERWGTSEWKLSVWGPHPIRHWLPRSLIYDDIAHV